MCSPTRKCILIAIPMILSVFENDRQNPYRIFQFVNIKKNVKYCKWNQCLHLCINMWWKIVYLHWDSSQKKLMKYTESSRESHLVNIFKFCFDFGVDFMTDMSMKILQWNKLIKNKRDRLPVVNVFRFGAHFLGNPIWNYLILTWLYPSKRPT